MPIIARGTRLFDGIDSLTLLCASLATSFEYHTSQNLPYPAGQHLVLEGLATNKMIKLPLHGVIESALNNKKADAIEVGIECKAAPKEKYQRSVSSIKTTLDNIFSPHFVVYFERHKDSIDKGPKRRFAPPWDMAWAIRNALSHNGRIHFSNSSYAPISWNQLTVTPDMEGTVVMGNLINIADLVLLMMDMDQCLF